MKKLILPAVALFALTFMATFAETADAQGFHFSSGRVHVDIGNPHGSHYVQPAYGGHGCHYGGGWGWGGGHSWHNTSHWDYHAPSLKWHGNHFDYVPGHYDWHQDGHWDHHHP